MPCRDVWCDLCAAGGRARGRHDVDVLRHAQLHRARDPARRGVRLLRGLVGAGRAHVRDAGRPLALRHRAGRRQPRPEHRGLPLPGTLTSHYTF
jgi:hypothetical protein